jgi:hypothetical protein
MLMAQRCIPVFRRQGYPRASGRRISLPVCLPRRSTGTYVVPALPASYLPFFLGFPSPATLALSWYSSAGDGSCLALVCRYRGPYRTNRGRW